MKEFILRTLHAQAETAEDARDQFVAMLREGNFSQHIYVGGTVHPDGRVLGCDLPPDGYCIKRLVKSEGCHHPAFQSGSSPILVYLAVKPGVEIVNYLEEPGIPPDDTSPWIPNDAFVWIPGDNRWEPMTEYRQKAGFTG